MNHALLPRPTLVLKCLGAALSIAAATAAAAAAQPGSVDLSFDPGRGPIAVSPGEGSSVVIQPDSKIIVGGRFDGVGLRETPSIVRFEPNGALDKTFDASQIRERFPKSIGVTAFALQSSGKVLAGVVFSATHGPEELVRLNPDGSIDPTFVVQFASDSYQPNITRVVVLPDDRILLAGSFNTVNGVRRMPFVRLHADGSLDPTFNPPRFGAFELLPNGQLILRADDLYRLHSDGSIDPTFSAEVPRTESGFPNVGSFLVQPGGKIVYTEYLNFAGDTAIRRLNADGSNDPTFHVTQDQHVYLTLIQADGKILSQWRRYHPDGTPDETFKPPYFDSYAIAQQPDGKIVAPTTSHTAPYGIRRLLDDGSLDPAFAVEGGGLTKIARAKIGRAAILPDGRIAVGGPFTHFGDTPRAQLAVLHSNGTVDQTFNTSGFKMPGLFGVYPSDDIVAQPDGKLLISYSGGFSRLNPDGSVDSSFNPPRLAYGPVFVQPDGKILVGNLTEGLMRLFSDGSRDFSFNSAVPGALVLLLEPDGRMIVSGHSRIAARLHPDGSLDDSFTGVGGAPTFDRVLAIARHPDGGYVVSRTDIVNSKSDLLFRTFEDGSPDPSFSSDVASAAHIVVDAAGITVAGDVGVRKPGFVPPKLYGVTRLNLNGSRDPSFQPTRFDGAAAATQLRRQSDGNLIITGDFTQVNGVPRPGVARLFGNAPQHLANIATRVRVGAGETAAIGGFIVVGDAPKRVIVRALGPSLAAAGLPSSALVADPVVDLIDSTGAVIASNNDWREAEADVSATGIPPSESAESAIVATLTPGAYTAVVRDARGEGGIGLVEIYDLNPGTGSALANISTRGDIGQGENVMIGGFMLRGGESSTIVARAIGPSLAAAGVLDVVTDPSLTLHNASGEIVAANDNWKTAQQAALEALQMGSVSDNEAALIVALPPGAYTAIVRGEGDDTGVGLVEIYHVP